MTDEGERLRESQDSDTSRRVVPIIEAENTNRGWTFTGWLYSVIVALDLWRD